MRKGQAALEFLMTYGWAILVVLVAIGALAYFGVLSPDKFLPSKCTLPAGIACIDHKIDSASNTLTFVLRNAVGVDITGVTVQANDPNNPANAICGASASAAINNGEQKTFVTAICDTDPVAAGTQALSLGKRFSGTIVLAYTNSESGLTKSVRGSLIGKVE